MNAAQWVGEWKGHITYMLRQYGLVIVGDGEKGMPPASALVAYCAEHYPSWELTFEMSGGGSRYLFIETNTSHK